MKIWVLALGISLFLEGVFLGISPQLWRETMQRLLLLSDKQIKHMGFGFCLTALGLILIARQLT